MVVRKKKEVRNCWGIEEGSVSGDCKYDFWTSKSRIGMWKLTEVEELVFAEDWGEPTNLWRIQYTLYWR